MSDASILDDVLSVVQRSPAALAVQDDMRLVTYGQLWNLAGQVARSVRAAGCPIDGLVLVHMSPSVTWVAGLIGIWRAGAVPVLANVEHPAQRIRQVAATADYVLSGSATSLPAWPERLVRIVPPNGAVPSDGWAESLDELPASACVLHTSGTSGAPKPVLLEHRGLVHRIRQLRALYKIVTADRIAQLAAPSVDVALWETLLALTSGARLEIPAGLSRIPGSELVHWLQQREITIITCTPTMLSAVPKTELPILRLIVLGGERLVPERHSFWIDRHQVANAYGPTEVTIETHVCLSVSSTGSAPIGYPVEGIDEFVLDDQASPVADGQVGELYLGGVGLAARYDGFPEATAAAFRLITIDGRTHRLYRTGDRVRRGPDGQLIFVDRVDRQLDIGGFRLEPAEIEQTVLLMSGVTAAAAFAEEDDERQTLVLHVAADSSVTTTEIRAYLAQQLPAPAVPSRIYVHAVLPTTDSGKPDFAALKAHSVADEPSPVVAVELPEPVSTWWEDATGSLPAHGVDFFDGGDSLAAVKLIHQVNEAFGLAITIADFVADPTPEFLTQALGGNREDTP